MPYPMNRMPRLAAQLASLTAWMTNRRKEVAPSSPLVSSLANRTLGLIGR